MIMSLNPSRPIANTATAIIIIFSLIFFFPHSARSQSPGRPSDNEPYPNQTFNPTMGVIIIVLVAALFFMGFFSVYIRHCAGRTSTAGASHRGIIARSVRPTRGLDRDVVESFPTFTYSAVKERKIGKGALECAVCLTEFDDDDTLRLIPKCDHVFHSDCIDPWLVGHTTCPVCRSNLSPDANDGASVHAQVENDGNDAVVGPIEECEAPTSANDDETNNSDESMEQPLHGRMSRNRTISIGRPRWFGKLTRSFTTGHVAVKQLENVDRFTLRLPEDVRKQIMSGKLERSTSVLVLPRETSSRRGFRIGSGFAEGSNRTGRSGSSRSDRWVFSLAPPFFSRAGSVRSPRVGTTMAAASREGAIRSESNRLPV